MKSISKLQLNEHQLQEVSRLERDSFVCHCRRVGCNPVEYEQLQLTTATRNLRELIKVHKDPELAKILFRETEELLNAPDFWTFKRLQKERETQGIVRHICDNAHTLPIAYLYLARLCNQLNISTPRSDDSSSLSTFLDSIPVVILFDLTFNAFVDEKILVDGVIPCVCMYDQLIVASDVFIDVVLAAAISTTSGMAAPTEQSRCRELGSQPSFQEELKQCIDLVLGISERVDLKYDDLLRSNPDMLLPFMIMSGGASRFVWYHEYGHLLMGHLAVGACHEVEFAADRFAWFLMNHQFDKTSIAAFWNFLGALVVMLIIGLLEKIFDVSESKTHPPARSRMQALLATLTEHDRNTMQEFLDVVIAICNPTLARYWNVSLDR